MKNKLCFTLALASTFLIASCSDNAPIETKVPFVDEIELLKKGFEIEGNVKIHKEYFKDIHHFRPSPLIEPETEEIDFHLIYEDTPDYIGSDRRFYKVKNNVKTFYFGENIFNDQGYVGMNYVDYENVVRRDGYASDDDGNPIPYSVSGYINPFKLIKPQDFIKEKDTISLNQDKASIFITTMLGEVKEIEENIVVDRSSFTFENTKLKNAVLYTKPLSGVKSLKIDGQYTNVYSTSIYEINLDFSKVGEASAYHAVKEEPNKPENDVVTKAFEKLGDGNYTVRRHLKAYDKTNQEYVPEEQCIDVYYAGDDHAVYQSIYDYQINKKETGKDHAVQASESDLLFLDDDNDDLLNTYALKVIEGTPKFAPAGDYYPTIEELFTYDSLLLGFTPVDMVNYKFTEVSGNIFNKNEDGTFSPIDDNIPYMANDCFVSKLQTTEEIAAGFVTEFKLSIKNQETDPTLDKLELVAEFGPFIHHITITYEDIGTTEVPFGVMDMLVK